MNSYANFRKESVGMMKRAKCKSCQTSIVWAKTAATGTNIPVDLAEYPDGNLVLEADSDGTYVAHVRGTVPRCEDTGRVYNRKSHFATCPNAARFRKEKAKKDAVN